MKSRENRLKEQGLIQWKLVGRRIRELRGFDVNQEEFARRIGVSQGYVSSMERGEKEVGIEILLKISREYGRSLEWLLLGNGWSDFEHPVGE
jgi:transcriptional regulator with XRE-family HTH domain